jgi:hypothetical protein
MKPLKILATDSSPAVNFDPQKEKFQIVGNSLPENSRGFYQPVIDWLDKYAEEPNAETEIEFKMILLNTSSTKLFIDIFRKINKIVEFSDSDVSVVWYYVFGDDDIHDVGVDFKAFCKANFELVAVNDETI